MVTQDKGKTIDQAVQNEAKQLVSALDLENNGEVTKIEWKTVFGSLFDKVQENTAGKD